MRTSSRQRYRKELATLVALVFSLTMGATIAAAHAIVIHTSLKKHPVAANTPTTVVLTFNLRVEAAFTKVMLVEEHQEKQTLEIVAGKNGKQLEVKVPALEPGKYQLEYKVLASDGHFTEGRVRFEVAPPK